MSTLQSESEGPPKKRRRTTTGCIGCRLRRKKCDEERPHCANCLRNSIVCTFPDPANPTHSQILRRTNLMHKRSETAPNATNDDGIGAVYGDSTASSPASLAVNDEGMARDSTGRLEIDILALLPWSLRPQMALGNIILRQAGAQRLFHHYVHRTNKALAICQGAKNPYLMELVPMAMSNQLVLHGILACSGIHHSVLSGLPADKETWMHYGQAIQGEKFGLTQLMKGQTSMLVPLLTTAIILCMVENFRNNSGVLALQHLTAARSLLLEALKLPESQFNQETRAFLVERYIYSIILSHITMGPSADCWVLDDAEALLPFIRTNTNRSLGAMLGCLHELFQFIPAVSVLARQRQAYQHGSAAEKRDVTTRYLKLRSAILSWQATSNDETSTLCGRIYQQALLVYLASSLESGQPGEDSSAPCYSPHVQAAFDAFIPLIETILPDFSVSTTLCWPLAIFGSCARIVEHRTIIREKLDMLSEAYSAHSVHETKQLLEKLWERNDLSMSNPSGLEHAMKMEKMTVLFL